MSSPEMSSSEMSSPASAPQKITVLGSTGSVGRSTLDVIRRHPQRYRVFALAAHTSVDALLEQCRVHHPTYAVLHNPAAAAKLERAVKQQQLPVDVLCGEQALIDICRSSSVDTIMAAIVGAAGLPPTFAAARAGKKILLANKEALVMAGSVFMDAVKQSGATLLPIDSEHNAIFQCLPMAYGEHCGAAGQGQDLNQLGLRKILLTGSGGPFRTWSKEAIAKATPEQACQHPKWSMGRKISVDSATLVNKGLEFIEARWLFNVSPDQIEVVIHPQSIVHSMVEYIDGSVIAQLGQPDMRIPIAHALSWPLRQASGVGAFDLIRQGDLQFQAPDDEKFPALSLAMQVAQEGTGAAIVFSAINEVAVDAFLNKRIGFTHIAQLLARGMAAADWTEPQSIDDVLHTDFYARQLARQLLEQKISA
ncbi:MAG: 1-deoxy-D-xylulose-5-phosphate reductoisomerase [Pseudomonadota bacterium]